MIEIFVAILAVVLGTIGAAVSYFVNKKIDRREREFQRRREIYAEYLSALSSAFDNLIVSLEVEGSIDRHAEQKVALSRSYSLAQLFAPDEVRSLALIASSSMSTLRSGSFDKIGEPPKDDEIREYVTARGNLINAMRQDLQREEAGIPVRIHFPSRLRKLLSFRP